MRETKKVHYADAFSGDLFGPSSACDRVVPRTLLTSELTEVTCKVCLKIATQGRR